MVVAVLWRHAAYLHYSGQGRSGTSVLSAKINIVAVVWAHQLTVYVKHCRSLRTYVHLRGVRESKKKNNQHFRLSPPPEQRTSCA